MSRTALLPPGRELAAQVRAAFVARHTTLGGWCRSQGIDRTAARQALYGTWNGPKGKALRARVIAAAFGTSARAAA